jgi:hypothetical protein
LFLFFFSASSAVLCENYVLGGGSFCGGVSRGWFYFTRKLSICIIIWMYNAPKGYIPRLENPCSPQPEKLLVLTWAAHWWWA